MTEQKSPKRKPFWMLNEEEQQQLVERTSRALTIDDRFWFLEPKEIRNLSTKKLHEVIAQTILAYDTNAAGHEFCNAILGLINKLLEDGKITEQKRLEIYAYACHLRSCLKTATGIDVTHSCAPLNYWLYGLLHSCPTEFRQEIETIIQNSGLFPKCACEQPEYCPFLAKQEFKNVDNFKEFKHYEKKTCWDCKTKREKAKQKSKTKQTKQKSAARLNTCCPLETNKKIEQSDFKCQKKLAHDTLCTQSIKYTKQEKQAFDSMCKKLCNYCIKKYQHNK